MENSAHKPGESGENLEPPARLGMLRIQTEGLSQPVTSVTDAVEKGWLFRDEGGTERAARPKFPNPREKIRNVYFDGSDRKEVVIVNEVQAEQNRRMNGRLAGLEASYELPGLSVAEEQSLRKLTDKVVDAAVLLRYVQEGGEVPEASIDRGSLRGFEIDRPNGLTGIEDELTAVVDSELTISRDKADRLVKEGKKLMPLTRDRYIIVSDMIPVDMLRVKGAVNMDNLADLSAVLVHRYGELTSNGRDSEAKGVGKLLDLIQGSRAFFDKVYGADISGKQPYDTANNLVELNAFQVMTSRLVEESLRATSANEGEVYRPGRLGETLEMPTVGDDTQEMPLIDRATSGDTARMSPADYENLMGSLGVEDEPDRKGSLRAFSVLLGGAARVAGGYIGDVMKAAQDTRERQRRVERKRQIDDLMTQIEQLESTMDGLLLGVNGNRSELRGLKLELMEESEVYLADIVNDLANKFDPSDETKKPIKRARLKELEARRLRREQRRLPTADIDHVLKHSYILQAA